MLVINKLTCAAAVAAAPFVLFGCSSKTEGGGGDQNGDGGVTTDENGIPSDAAASTKALASILGNGLYRNYENCPPEDGRNATFIGKALGAVVAYTKQAVGNDTLVDQILAEWKNGDPVPGPAADAINSIVGKKVVEGDDVQDDLITLDDSIWDADCKAKAAQIVSQPAVDAISGYIKSELKKAGLPCDDAAVQAAFSAAAAAIDALAGEGTVARVAAGWSCGQDVPGPVIDAVADQVAAAQQQR